MSSKILAAGNGKSIVKEAQILFHIKDFCNKYKPGEYMFYYVLYRNFKDDVNKVIDFLVKNEYAKKDRIYRCPHCDFYLATGSVVNKLSKESTINNEPLKLFCEACDNEFTIRDYNSEIMLIRTSKKFE